MERFKACMKGYSSTKRGLGIEEGKYHTTKFVLVSTIYDTSTTSTHLCSSLTSMVNNDGVDYQAAAWVSHSSFQSGCLIKVYLYLEPITTHHINMHLQVFMSLLVRHICMMYSCLISASSLGTIRSHLLHGLLPQERPSRESICSSQVATHLYKLHMVSI